MQISGTPNQTSSPTEPTVAVQPATEPVAPTEPVKAAPASTEPAVPVQTVADDSDFLNLLLGLEDEPTQPAPQQPTPAQPAQPKRLSYADVVADQNMFETYMQQRDQELFQAATQHALQQMIPVASQMVVKALAYQTAAEKFWSDEKNQVLVPYAQTFGKLVDQMTKKDPTISPIDLYNKAGKVLHAAIARTGGQGNPANVMPVPPTATARPNGVPNIDPAKAKLRQIFRWNDLPNK